MTHTEPPQHQSQTATSHAARNPAIELAQPALNDNAASETARMAGVAAAKPAHPIRDRGVASLVLGITSVIPYIGWIPAIFAIVYGHKTRQEFDVAFAAGNLPVNSKTGMPTTRGFATAGLVLGIVCVSLYTLIIVVVLLALLLS